VKIPWLTNSSAKQSQRDSPLLRLPPEIRNTIFEYALGGRTILLESTPFKYGDLKAVSLLAVSRQIYAETAMILFSANTFSASNPKSMALFLREQASTSVVRVTTVQVQCNVIVCDPRLFFPELKQYAYIEKSFEQFDLKMPHLRRITFLPHIDDRTNGWDSSEIRIEVEACLERLAQRAKSKNPNLLVMVGKISSTKGPLVA
jgi:hypothetical protein